MGLGTPVTDYEDYKEMAGLLQNFLVFFTIFVPSIQSSYILHHTDKISKDDINQSVYCAYLAQGTDGQNMTLPSGEG